jgi:HSP20 family protein
MVMSRYDPFREAVSLRRAMDDLFAQSFIRPGWGRSAEEALAPMDVRETDHGYNVRVAMPGVKPENIEVTVQQNTLTIRGQYATQDQEKEQGNWVMREISSGSFERSVTFPRPIDPDHIETHYENGVLTLTLPVSEANRPRRINIASGQSTQQQVTVEAAKSQEQ